MYINGVIVSDLINQPIIAQCTPSGSGAIALLRLTGAGSIELVAKMSKLANKQTLLEVPTHTIHSGWIINNHNEPVDQVMLLLMQAPRTFTGDDTVEITCHNNPFIIQTIIEQAVALGARLAQPGEFTRRAVENNKIDLVQAEAINELIHAQTQHALKASLSQLRGSLSQWTAQIERHLIKALAFCEASFEFIDEEMEFGDTVCQTIELALTDIAHVKKSFDAQQHIRQGIRVAIIGSVNAGKSSLFNALLNKERAIVTSIAGTTRDSIEAGLYKNGNYWTLIDTAGLRQTFDIVEQEGIKRSFEQAQLADIILLVFDASRELTPQEAEVYYELQKAHAHKIIHVHNKSDAIDIERVDKALLRANENNNYLVSSKTRENIELLEQTIQHKISSLFNAIESPFLLNTRQFTLLLNLEIALQEIITMLNGPIAYELVSYHIQQALAQLSELTGKTISEAGMDAVFREFCVGK